MNVNSQAVNGVIAVFLSLSLTSCSIFKTDCKPITKTVIEKQVPPRILLLYIQEPMKPIVAEDGTITNGQLEEWFRAYQSSLRQCNNSLQSLREWAEIEESK